MPQSNYEGAISIGVDEWGDDGVGLEGTGSLLEGNDGGGSDYSREAMWSILFEDLRFNIIFLKLHFRLLHLTGIFNGSSNCKLITTTVSNICLVDNSSKKC